MAVTMRLRRMGRRNRPFYRLVVTDSRNATDGRFLETLGHYDPLKDPADVVIDEGKVRHWLGQGAGMSDTVRSLLRSEGILKRWHDERTGTTPGAGVDAETKSKSDGTDASTKGSETG